MKKKLSKRALAMLAALVMCLGMLPGTAFAAGDCNGHHTWKVTRTGEGIWAGVCRNCGTKCAQFDEEGEHKLSWTTYAATCEEPMKQVGTCSCGEHEEHNVGTPLGHAWDEGKVTKEATCTEEGVKTYTCKRDSSHVKTEPVPKSTEHTPGEPKLENPASCFEKGNWTVYCTVCNAEIDHTEAPAWDADYAGQKWEPAGNGQHKMVCKNCGGRAAGHSVVESCEDTDGDLKCDDCGAEVRCDHRWGNHMDESQCKAPTCTEKGQEVFVCNKCGAVLQNKELEPLGHDLETYVEGETCETDGYIHVKCARPDCDYETRAESAAYGHDYGETAARTEIPGNDGQHTVICKNNSEHTTTEPHAYSDWTSWSEWVNDEDGGTRTRTRSRVCAACGHSQTDSQTGNIPDEGGDGPEPTPAPTPTPVPTPTPGPVTPTPDPAPEIEIDENETPLTESVDTADDSTGDPEETEIADEEPPLTETPGTEIADEELPLTEIPETEIADEELPLTETPETEIADEALPLTETPETEIADEEPPLTETPETEIADEELPLTETPETEIADEELPLTEAPAEEEVPLSDVPVTGDDSHVWGLAILLSAASLIWLALGDRKQRAAGK